MADVEIRIEGQDNSVQASKSAQSGIRGISDEAKKANVSLSDHATKLDRAGESADNAETRFTGLASGIDGVTTLMDDPSPQEFAQGIADMSDGVANAAVPALKAAKEGLSNFVEGLGGVKNVLIGGAVVGAVAGLAVAVNSARDAANDRTMDEYAQQLERTGFAATDAAKASLQTVEAAGELDNLAKQYAEEGGSAAVESLIELAKEAGLSSDSMQMLNDKLEDTGTTSERAADSVGDLHDAFTAMTDPVFAAINAQQQYNEATAAYNELAASGTATQAELEAAMLAVGEASASQDAALVALQEAFVNGDVSAASFESTLRRWEEQGGATAATARFLRERFRRLDEQARATTDDVGINVHADGLQYAIGAFDALANAINNALRAANNFSATGVPAHVSVGGGGGMPFAHGGITSAAAHGGPRGGRILAGEFGPEIIDGVPPGSMVHTAGDTKRILSMEGRSQQPTIVNIYAQGSIMTERDLVGLVAEAARNGAFDGTLVRA